MFDEHLARPAAGDEDGVGAEVLGDDQVEADGRSVRCVGVEGAGADPDLHGPAARTAGEARPGPLRQGQAVAVALHPEPVAFGDELAGQEVHLGAADEAGDEPVGRMPEQVFRGALLLDLPFGHDHDPVPQGHRLGLVVGDVDHVLAQAVAHSGQLRAHPGAQVRIQVRERLVEQEGRRVPHQRPPHGHALALPPGQLGRLAVQQVGDVEGLRDALDLAPDLCLGDTLQP